MKNILFSLIALILLSSISFSKKFDFSEFKNISPDMSKLQVLKILKEHEVKFQEDKFFDNEAIEVDSQFTIYGESIGIFRIVFENQIVIYLVLESVSQESYKIFMDKINQIANCKIRDKDSENSYFYYFTNCTIRTFYEDVFGYNMTKIEKKSKNKCK